MMKYHGMNLPQYSITRKTLRTDEKFESVIEKILKHYPNWDIDRTDGIKIRKGERWILARPSGTEPIIRIFVQGKNENDSHELMKEVETFLQ